MKRRWLLVLEATTYTRIYGQQQLGKYCVFRCKIIFAFYNFVFLFLVCIYTSRMQASGERRRVLHRRPRLCIVPIH